MAHRPSCRSCRHCVLDGGALPNGVRPGWCRMRQLAIHPELTAELWCPHWTARPPRLPLTSQATAPGGAGGSIDRQLSLAGMLEAVELGLLDELPPVD